MNEVVESTAVEVAQVPGKLFAGRSGTEIIKDASEKATALAQVIEEKGLFSDIRGRKHVLVEGWTLLGSLVGVFPVCVWTRQMDNGWEARVEARTLSGEVVGAAEAQCTKDERMWAQRDDYALRSMAQTRATSKALRQPLGFIMVLGGYDATPREEMPDDHNDNRQPDNSRNERRNAMRNANVNGPVASPEPADAPKQNGSGLSQGQKSAWLTAFKKRMDGMGVTVSQVSEVVGGPFSYDAINAYLSENKDLSDTDILEAAKEA